MIIIIIIIIIIMIIMIKSKKSNLTWTGCTCPELKEVEGSYNWSFPSSQPLSVLTNRELTN